MSRINELIAEHCPDGVEFKALGDIAAYSHRISTQIWKIANDVRGAEQKISQYLVDNNCVETVISLAPNLFFGTTIAVNILVLSRHKTDTTTQFIDASGLFRKETNNNVLLDAHIEQIMAVFDSKKNVDHFAQSIPFEQVAANDYNLSVSSYVEAKDTREVVDIALLNAELKVTVARIDQLRKDIDAIVVEIEGGEG